MDNQIPSDDQLRENEICSLLDSYGYKYEKYQHQKVMTVNEAEAIKSDIPGASIKNLFLKDKKDNYYLFSALFNSKFDLVQLEQAFESKRLRFASHENLMKVLNIHPGSVTPLAISQDHNNIVTLAMDSNIKKFDKIVVHPLHNYASISISTEDFIDFSEKMNHPIKWIDLQTVDINSASQDSTSGKKHDQTSPIAHDYKSKEASTLGVSFKKTENFTDWYTQVIQKSEMIDYYDISGCYIIRPWAFFIWETIQSFFDKEIKKLDVENCSFPLFLSKTRLEAEKNHVEGFSPEVAWVTKYGDSDLTEPIAIRPTSETIMYPSYAKWIRSHRDLPLKLNQWNTVVRWEFKQPTPFIRSREFLWQEGHTAHATEEEAYDFTLSILELYRQWYEDYFAVPVIKGTKSENEKFAGGKTTVTIESFIEETGRGIQAGTSHLLGTNFAKIFDLEYEDKNGNKQFCHQTSWGCSMRSLGIMIMMHGDNLGLVLPPKVARYQVVIIPITFKDGNNEKIFAKCKEVQSLLTKSDVRFKLDDRDNYTPGWKYNHWEMKGVPIRIEIGPRDVTNNTVRAIRRDNQEKMDLPIAQIEEKIPSLLEDIQKSLFEKATAKMDAGIEVALTFKQAFEAVNRKKLALVPWCEDPENEEEIRKESQALSQKALEQSDSQISSVAGIKCLCIPFKQSEMPLDTKCFWTGKPALRWSLWGRSY